MTKLGELRKSKRCPRCCDRKGCFEKYELVKHCGKTYKVWKLHCKTLDQVEVLAIKKGR